MNTRHRAGMNEPRAVEGFVFLSNAPSSDDGIAPVIDPL